MTGAREHIKVHLWGMFSMVGYPALVMFSAMLHDNYPMKVTMFCIAWLGSIFHYTEKVSTLDI